jgi:hypothetical protein
MGQPPRSLLQPRQLDRDLLPPDVPADCENDWLVEAIMTAIQAGPSPTVLMPEVKALIKEDLQYKVNLSEGVWSQG